MNAHDLAEHPNWAHQLESIGCAGEFAERYNCEKHGSHRVRCCSDSFEIDVGSDVCGLCLVARADHWAPSDSQVPDVREVRAIEQAVDRELPRGVIRIRGGIVIDVVFDSGNACWGARFTYKRNRLVRVFSTSDVYGSPSGALWSLLKSVRQTPKDLW